MAKKSKSKPSKAGGKKMRKLIIKLVLFVILGASLAVLYQPELIQDEASRARVVGIRTTMEEGLNTSNQQLVKILAPAQNLSQTMSTLPKGVVLGEREVYLEDAVGAVTSQLETLPTDHYQRFKSSFCADVVATMSAVQAEN